MRKHTMRIICCALALLAVVGLAQFLPPSAAAAGDAEVISESTTWEATTLSNDVQIAGGVTVTVNGAITISGEVTISGGGTIARGSSNAYFSIGSGASLTLDGVTVDGKSTSSGNSMFDVDSGTLYIKNSTVQNCVKNTSRGGAINMEGGTLTIENTTIKNCSSTSYGGAIYLDGGATATIKSGTFSGNKTTNTSLYGGGFIYNRGSTLTILGGSFLNNSSNGRGGAVYNTAIADTETYILGGVFEGNTSSYSGYEGSGAVFYSSEYENETVLYISGSAQFGSGTASDGTDGVYLDSYSSTSTLRKMQISSALQYPVHIYVACSEGRAIAEGVEGYTLTAADMTRMHFHDIGSSGTTWYAWLDSTNNEVDVSATEPIYVVYDANGATGMVTDNTIYSTDNNTVTVKSGDGLTYDGATFTGWNTSADGSGTAYQPGTTFNITETTTLYAQWAYNVWVGGTQVTSLNASDVLGEDDGEGATVTYDAENKTLILNGASITSTYDDITDMGSVAILSFDELNIVLAEGSENSITLDGDSLFTCVYATDENGTTYKDITVSGNGSLDIDINTNADLAIGVMGGAIAIDGGADVRATIRNDAGNNIAIMSAGTVTIEDAELTASGYAGIMGMGNISITGTSTVTATGSAYAIATAGNITLDDSLLAQGRVDAEAGGLEAVEIGNATAAGTENTYSTFVLSSDKETTVAKYVEIKLAHSHNVCGGTGCDHVDHTAVAYAALDSSGSSQTLDSGNYYLTDDIKDVGNSILITGNVNICLNGHEISGDASDGIFRVGQGGVLTVCDCQSEGVLSESDSHNPVFVHSGGVFNLYSGTVSSSITAIVIDEDPSNNDDSTGGTVNIYGGTVSSSGTGSQAIKVNANMTNAAVNIYDGNITGNYAVNLGSNSTLTLSGQPTLDGITADLRLDTQSGVTSADDAKVDATGYEGGELSVVESSLSESKIGSYAIKVSPNSQGKFTLTNNGYVYLYKDGGLLIHQHDYNYTASDNTITETCANGCNHSATATIAAPTGTLTYDGTTSFNATVEYSDGWAGGDLTISYKKDGSTTNDTTGAGDYTASITIEGETASVSYTVAEANQNAPGTNEGYTIDYENETITVTSDDYELSSDGSAVAASPLKLTPGTDVYIRKAGNDNYNASGWTIVDIPGRPEAPAAPTVTGRTPSSITVKVVTGQEYSIDGGNTWQDGGEFNDLTPSTEYTIYTRVKAVTGSNSPAFASGISKGTTTSTLGENGSGTVNPGETITTEDGTTIKNDGTTVTITPDEGSQTIITKPDSGSVNVNEDGDVIVPDGSTVKTEDGTEITIGKNDCETTVGTDGSIKLPNDGSVETTNTNGETTTITAPSGGEVKDDGNGSITVPNGGTVQTGENGTPITLPGGGTVNTGTGAVTPNDGGSVTIPDGQGGSTTITPPEGEAVTPGSDGSVTIPGGSTVTDSQGNSHTYPEEGGSLEPGGVVKYTVTVTFDSAGGSDIPSRDVDVNTPVPEPKAPYRSGYIFLGWYTERYSGVLWDFSAPVPGDMTLYARWMYIPVNPNYQITISETEHGTVTVSPESAKEGDTVTITPEPEDGFEVGRVTVIDRDGGFVTVNENGDGTYSFTMPDGQVAIDVVFTAAGAGLPFPDVSGSDWFYDAVEYVYSTGLMDGVDGGLFGPNMATTRAQVVTILWRLQGEPVVDYRLDYTDVDDGGWYVQALRWAASEGIATGYGDGRFGPNAPITREQLAAMLHRYDGGEAAGDVENFADADTVSNWARESLEWAVGRGIINGVDGNRIDPQGEALRCQLAAMLKRYCESIAE